MQQFDEGFEIIATTNKAVDKEKEFYIPAKEFLYIKKNHNIVGIYHSHIVGSSEPSDFDLKTADLVCYPFIIYSLEKNTFNIHVPEYSDANEDALSKLRKELV